MVFELFLVLRYCLKTGSAAVSAKKKPSAGVTSGSATVVRSKGANKSVPKAAPKIEKELDDAEVEAIIQDLLPGNVVVELSNPVWKTR